ncbi:RNA-directed DNA polymerase, eukaryota [Tanacetum coccineum]
MPKERKLNLKRTARISVRLCCFSNPRPVSIPYHALSPPTDYQSAPPSTPNALPPPSPIISPGISPRKVLLTPKSTPPPLTSPSSAPTQPSKHSSPLAINLDPIRSISLSPSNDRWAWLLGSSGEFSVHSARTFIDDILLPFVGDVTRWVKVVPIKVNILAWKVCLDKLPTRLNLSLCGIDIPSIICPNCGLAGESCSHLFYSCNLARTFQIFLVTKNGLLGSKLLGFLKLKRKC